jgi:NAD(P)-dependent dehydrogenase (short-subunit alcohol dehydrogenase family)
VTGFLEGRVAIVTGAGQGIGKGVAKLMAKEGAKVVVVDPGVNVDGTGKDLSLADQVVDEIIEDGGIAIASNRSVGTMEVGEAIIQMALEEFGKLDIVITCHGILRDRMIFNMSEDEWDSVINVHLKGTFTIVRPACSLFRKQGYGRIVTFTSESGLVGNSGQANYGAAKAGIAGFTKVVARDMGKYNVTANSIAPRAATRMTSGIPDSAVKAREELGIMATEGEDELSSANPDDIAPFTVYLASEYAHNINGQTFLVYGGVVSLFNEPESTKTISKEGRWTIEELASVFPSAIGSELFNPAPSLDSLSQDNV